jgi:hypothetical protein
MRRAGCARCTPRARRARAVCCTRRVLSPRRAWMSRAPRLAILRYSALTAMCCLHRLLRTNALPPRPLTPSRPLAPPPRRPTDKWRRRHVPSTSRQAAGPGGEGGKQGQEAASVRCCCTRPRRTRQQLLSPAVRASVQASCRAVYLDTAPAVEVHIRPCRLSRHKRLSRYKRSAALHRRRAGQEALEKIRA